MLGEMFEDQTGYISSEKVDGALFKANITDIPDKYFSKSGMNKLLSELGVKFTNMSYVKPRMDTPCMYGSCEVLGDPIAVESLLSWKDLKSIKQGDGGIFSIEIFVQYEGSFLSRLMVTWDVEQVDIESIPMSPILSLITNENQSLDAISPT